jgi:Bacterial EndoU nuclease
MGKRRHKKRLPPFFDRVDNPELHNFPVSQEVDITPPPPQLNEFDRDLLQVCGNLGDRVHRESFKALMRAYPEVLERIHNAVDGEIFRGRKTKSEFLEDLTAIWFKRQGFQHIFCGVIHDRNLKGLHYFGRYLELQEKGLAGRLPYNWHEEEVIPGVVYTLGVLLKYGQHTIVDRRNGYALITDAIELLIAATQAFKSQPRGKSVCTFSVIDREEGVSYPAVFVKEDDAIVTFFPDATPEHPSCK